MYNNLRSYFRFLLEVRCHLFQLHLFQHSAWSSLGNLHIWFPVSHGELCEYSAWNVFRLRHSASFLQTATNIIIRGNETNDMYFVGRVMLQNDEASDLTSRGKK